MRVVIVDGDQLFRSGFREVLERDGIEVAGEAASPEQALHEAPQLSPDVVAIEPFMQGVSEVDTTPWLRALAQASVVLVVSDSSASADVARCIDAGASGYVTKASSEAELVTAVRTAAAGGAIFAPAAAATLLELVRTAAPSADAALSERELEVLRLVAEGKDNAEIARQLFISSETVKNHISKILAKLQVDNRIQAAVYAVRARIV
jgi:DNA-binding NarL/FixJ family response regulator